MSQQNERDPHQPASPKDRESDDLIPDEGQQDDEDRASVIRPPRPAGIPPGGFPPPIPAPHDPPALGGDNILDPD